MIKISINKLSEFLADSNAARRQKIVEEQIQPKIFIVKRYEDAKSTIIASLCQVNPPTLSNMTIV